MMVAMVRIRFRTVAIWAALTLSACSTDSCSCAGFEPRAWPSNKVDETIPGVGQARVTRAGLDYVNSQVPYLLDQALPGGLSFCFPQDTSGNPDVCVASTCASGAPGCQLDFTLADHSISPTPPDTVEVDIVIGGIDERLNFDYDAGLFTANCYVQLFKAGASEQTAAVVAANVPIRIFADQASPMREVGVDIGDVTLNLEDVDFKIHGRGNVGDTVACEGASLVRGLFRGMIEDEIRNYLSGAVNDVRRSQLCHHCGAGMCPNGSTCAGDGVCEYSANSCVPRTLGIEGRLDLGTALGGFVRESAPRLDALAKGADIATVDTGVTVGLRGGFTPVSVSDCVPADEGARPVIPAVTPSPTVTGSTKPGGGSFMMSVGLHKSAIEQTLWSAWASGGTCLEVSDRDVMILSTTAFSLVAPSMKDLALNGKSAVLSVVANEAPTVVLGANTVTPSGDTYTVTDPLLRILWNDVDFHVFAFAQDRMTRMFTLRLDLDLPIALVPDGNGNLVPIVPDLEDAIADVEPRRLELLSEDANKIRDVVPTLLGVAAPQLAGAIPEAIALPEFMGFRLDLGQGDITSVDNGEYLAVFANLARGGSPSMVATDTLIRSSTVSYDRVLESGFVRPEVTLDVAAWSGQIGPDGREYEFSWRVDGGFWSMYRRSTTLLVDDPILAIQGSHQIDVRARVVGEPLTADASPAQISVVTDWEDPELEARRSGTDLLLEGRDLADEELEYRVVDALGRESGWTKETKIDTAAANLGGEITVEARDDSGRTAATKVRLPPAKTGCSTTGGAGSLLPLLMCVLVAFRRRRLALFAVMGASLLSACGGCKGELRTNADQQCFGPACNVDQDCTVDSDCAGICPDGNGGICEADRCMCVKACDPGCDEKAFCCLSTQECVSFGDPCGGELTCDPGYEPGVGSATPNRETCELEDIQCECLPLPPISVGWHGQYASIDSDGGLTVVATYNKTYGDLMVGRVQADATIEWHYVDGVPADGLPTGDPNGPRRGIEDKATHVGTHTAVVVDGTGRAHVFYRDEDQKALKWGLVDFSSTPPSFQSVVLDADGEPGHWTSAAIAGDTIHVLHTALEAPSGSELRHVQLQATGAPATGAMSAVVLTEAAAEQGKGYPVVVASYTDLSVTNGTPFAVFFNGVQDRVGRMQFASGAWAEPTYVAAGTGPYAGGALGTDGLEHVAFMLSSGLRYSRFGDTATSLVDDGMRLFADEYWNGATGEDAALRLDGTNVTVAYQDAFDRTLVVAKSTDAGETWTPQRLPVDGAGSGFYIALTHRGEPWVADFVVDRRADPVGHLRVTRVD